MASNEGKKKIIELAEKEIKRELEVHEKSVKRLKTALLELKYGNVEKGLKECTSWQ